MKNTSLSNYKSTYEILQGIADIYQEIVETDKKSGSNNVNLLLETLAGKNRANIAASILQNPDMLRDVFEDAQDSAGSADEELSKFLNSIDGKIYQLTNSVQEFWFTAIESDTIKSALDFVTALVNKLTELVDTIGLIPSLAGAFGAFKGLGASMSGGGRAKEFMVLRKLITIEGLIYFGIN